MRRNSRVCSKCKRLKPIEAFIGKRRKKHRKYYSCTECRDKNYRAHHNRLKERQLEIRIFIYEYLASHPCACGEKAPEVLEFDHRRDKKFNISHASRLGYSLREVVEEIAKTVVMCSNCHRRKTATEQNWYADVKRVLSERRERKENI